MERIFFVGGLLIAVGTLCLMVYRLLQLRDRSQVEGVKRYTRARSIILSDLSLAACSVYYGRFKRSEINAYSLLVISVLVVLTVLMMLYGANMPNLITYSHRPDQSFDFVNGIVFKVTVVVLTLFVVGLLLRLYRYHLKIADFYRSRFDGIILMSTMSKAEREELKDLMDLVNPPFDVGNQRMPIDQITKIIEASKTTKGQA